MEGQGREPGSWETEQKAPAPETSKPGKKMDGDTVHSPSQHPSPCTYIGEVQAQLEFFIQPLASVIVGSWEKEDAVKQLPTNPTLLLREPTKESEARPSKLLDLESEMGSNLTWSFGGKHT